MGDRFFAFGCSYTNWVYPTWADYIGINFKEFRNYGRAGGSNQHILEKVIETDNIHSFNENDTVYIMLTGVYRFTYCDNNNKWNCDGDLFSYLRHNPKSPIRKFAKDIFNPNFAVYQTWIAVHAIKKILEGKGVNLKFFMGIDNSHYMEKESQDYGNILKNNTHSINRMKDVYNMCEFVDSFDSWKNRYKLNEHVYYKINNQPDGHPHYSTHLKYIREFLPDFYTSKAKKLEQQIKDECKFLSQHEQGEDWDRIRRQFTIMDI